MKLINRTSKLAAICSVVCSVMLLSSLAFAEVSTDEIANQIKVLSEKLDKLQSSMNTRLDQLEKSIAESGPKGDPEAAAKAAFTQIHQLVGANKFDEAKKQLASFSQNYAGSALLPHAARLKQELDVVGKDAPKEWKIEKWLQGEDKIKLGGDNPTLVVFWELWCPHCRREVPRIQQLHDKFSPKGFQVVGLTKMTRGKTEKEVTDFLAEQKVNYPSAKESGDLSDYFAVSGIPAAVVIKDGKVAWRGHPARLNDGMIEAWL